MLGLAHFQMQLNVMDMICRILVLLILVFSIELYGKDFDQLLVGGTDSTYQSAHPCGTYAPKLSIEEEGCIAPLYGGSEPEVLEAVSPQWMVYPNPTQGDGWILHRGDGAVPIQGVRVLDASGRVIWQARGATEGEVSPYLPGGLWAPGVYYIEIQTARGRETMTWMIKR
jgi:hypothetical protein